MNAIPYDRPGEDWDSYQEGTEEEQFALPGRPRRQWFNRKTAALFAVVLGAIGFYAGVRVEKSQLSNSSSTTGAFGAAGGGAAASRAAGARGTGASGSGTTGAAGASGTGAASRAGASASGSGFRGLFGGGGGGLASAAGGAGATFGTVSSISGDNLYITETSGNTVKVALSGATKVTKNVTVGKKAVRPGDTVVVAGAKNSNGTVAATTLSDTGAGAGAAAGGGGSSSSSRAGADEQQAPIRAHSPFRGGSGRAKAPPSGAADHHQHQTSPLRSEAPPSGAADHSTSRFGAGADESFIYERKQCSKCLTLDQGEWQSRSSQ